MADETYTVERSAVMSAPPERIYEQIADFHNWPHWSPWEGLDPDMRRTYSGANSGTSAAYSWSGNRRAGQGRMEIRSASAPSAARWINLCSSARVMDRSRNPRLCVIPTAAIYRRPAGRFRLFTHVPRWRFVCEACHGLYKGVSVRSAKKKPSPPGEGSWEPG